MNRQFHIPIEGLSKKEINDLNSLLNKSHSTGFIKIEGRNIIASPFGIHKPVGFESPTNYPLCCPYHKAILENINKWFSKFPNCCDAHREIANKSWFKKSNYYDTPIKIMMQLAFTEYHIEKNLSIDNWYKDITDYFEYNLASFGQPSIGIDSYIILLKDTIKRNRTKNKLLKDRYNRLIEYLQEWSKQHVEDKKKDLSNETDINLLNATFQKWVTTIPNIGFFSDIKLGLKDKIPIGLFIYDSEYNPYLQEVRSKVRTRSELIEVLINFTKKILLELSNENEIHKKSISELNKHQIVVIGEKHKISQAKLLGDFTNGEIGYVNVIKKWLKNEELYFNSIQELLVQSKMPEAPKPIITIKKILFLSANPIPQDRSGLLRIEDEFRQIKDEVQSSSQRDKFELLYEPAVKIKTITRVLQTHLPYFVHFSGHGSGEGGLIVQNEFSQAEFFPNIHLDKLFKLFKKTIKFVILNACYSTEQAKIISKHGIYVIGMNDAISDKAATDFAVGFYQSIAEGNSIKFAFQIGLITNSSNTEESNTPELWKDGKIIKFV
ncbi:hypothetical protein GCM10028818_22650 [Spirosoma horti]